MDTEHLSDYLSEQDRAVIDLSGYGQEGTFGNRPALLVIDVTYAFCGDRPEPILDSIVRFRNSSGQDAWDAVAVIERLIETARGNDVPVIYTRGMSPATTVTPGRWASKNRRAGEDTDHAHDIVEQIAPQPGDTVLRKAKPSAFFGTPLLSHLIEQGVDSLVICGGTTSGCVRASVVDAFSYNFPVAVVADACFDRIQASEDISLLDMDLKYADVVRSSQCERLLTAQRSASA